MSMDVAGLSLLLDVSLGRRQDWVGLITSQSAFTLEPRDVGVEVPGGLCGEGAVFLV